MSGNPIPTFLDPLKSNVGQSLAPGSSQVQDWLWGGGKSSLTGVSNMYGVDTGSKTYAGDTYAALTRDQWQTYVSTFVPLENQLIDYATDKNKPLEAMQKASQNVNSAFTMEQGAAGRQLGGLGVSLNPDEKAAQDRSFGLSKALADVGAQNMAGSLTRQRQQAILGNPAPQASTAAITGG